MKIVAQNKEANRLYNIEDRIEAGIELKGTEVKSIREGRISLKNGFARIKKGELFLSNIHISEYKDGSFTNHDPKRDRRLLVHKRELKRLIGKQKEKGYTLVPIKVYFKNKWLKVEIGIGKGKRQYEKREDIKKREHQIAIDRELKKYRLKK